MELENKWVTANDLIIGQEIKGIHKGRWIRYFSVFVKKVDSECTVCGKKEVSVRCLFIEKKPGSIKPSGLFSTAY